MKIIIELNDCLDGRAMEFTACTEGTAKATGREKFYAACIMAAVKEIVPKIGEMAGAKGTVVTGPLENQ